MRTPVDLQFCPAFNGLFTPARYKIYYGGRGGAKTRSFARALVLSAYTGKELILCAREHQNSIADSVHRVIVNEIESLGLYPYFKITDQSIRSWTGSEFIFKGLHRNVDGIKSTEGITKCWVEEAQRTTKDSWNTLMPTIRGDETSDNPLLRNPEIWVSFNPEQFEDATPQLFMQKTPPNTILKKVGWQDNLWFPRFLDEQRRHMLITDPDAYDHVWEGNFRKVTDAVIFRGKYEVKAFETPTNVDRFYFGADWGFAHDPTCLIRSWVKDEGQFKDLYIDYEAYGYGTDLLDIPALFDLIPGARGWPISGDCAQPMIINHLRGKGFNIHPCEKWKGSIEDGIAFLRGFRRIYIHERCEHMAREARLYCYKTDPRKLDDQGQPVVLPIVVDAHNHGWDSTRYGLEPFIIAGGHGGIGNWEGMLT